MISRHRRLVASETAVTAAAPDADVEGAEDVDHQSHRQRELPPPAHQHDAEDTACQVEHEHGVEMSVVLVEHRLDPDQQPGRDGEPVAPRRLPPRQRGWRRGGTEIHTDKVGVATGTRQGPAARSAPTFVYAE